MRERERKRENEGERMKERGRREWGWVDERELECNITYSSTAGFTKSSNPPPKKKKIIIITIKIINKQILSQDLSQSEDILGGRSCAQAKHEQ